MEQEDLAVRVVLALWVGAQAIAFGSGRHVGVVELLCDSKWQLELGVRAMASMSKLLQKLLTWAFPLLYIALAVLSGRPSMEQGKGLPAASLPFGG